MNSLSWLLYLSELAGSFEDFLFAIIMMTLIVCGTLIIHNAVEHERSAKGPVAALVAVIVTCGLMMVIIPPKQTILMIAASEIGEAVVKTPEAQEIFTDLKAVLKKQLEAMKK